MTQQNEEKQSLLVNLFGYGVFFAVLGVVLYVLAFVVSVPIALYSDKVYIQEFALKNNKLTLVGDGNYISEDWLLGFPATVNNILGSQIPRLFTTTAGNIVDLEDYQPAHTIVINSLDQPLYNTYSTYGNVELYEDAELNFMIEARSQKSVKYFVADKVGCDNPPPSESRKSVISWTTLVPAQSCHS